MSWEKFARNFKDFYELGNKVQAQMATNEILDEEVETLNNPDAAGPGVPHAGNNSQGGIGSRFRYDGKIYDKQITPEMLRGLQDTRIAGVMTRFGDTEGATKMLTSKAQLKNLQLDNEVKEGTLAENIRKVKIDNDAKVASMDLTKEQIARYKELTPLMAEKYLADIDAQETSTYQSKVKFPTEIASLIAKGKITVQQAKEFMDKEAIESREGLIKNQNLQNKVDKKNIKLEDKEADLAMDKLTSTYENQLATYILDSGTAKTQAEAAELAANQNKLNQEVLTDFATKMAKKEFESPEAQKAWLIDNWTGDPRVKTMIADITAVQLSQITAEGTKMMAEVNAALTGKNQNGQKDALVKVMDMQDGISGNMQFVKNEKGITQLVEYPSVEDMKADTKKTGKGGTIVVNENGTKQGWDGFTEGLTAEFTPLKSLEIAKANADIAYVNAQTSYKLNESDMKLSLSDSKVWGDHTQTELYRYLSTLTQADFKEKTNFDTMDEYAKDYIRRSRAAVSSANYKDYKMLGGSI
tara:strand:- start:162 stop:1739 length:1578 start_codon:yes stop_codon:yes gene_type:complete